MLTVGVELKRTWAVMDGREGRKLMGYVVRKEKGKERRSLDESEMRSEEIL